MPTSKIEIKERVTGYVISIITTHGKEYRLSVLDGDDSLEITSNNGAIDIRPRAINQILVTGSL